MESNIEAKTRLIHICKQKELKHVLHKLINQFNPEDIVIIRFSSIERVDISPFNIPDENIFDAIFKADDFDIFREETGKIIKNWIHWEIPLPEIPDIKLFEELNNFIEERKEKPVWVIHCDEAENRSPAIAFALAVKFDDKKTALEIFSKFNKTINLTFAFMLLKEDIVKLLCDI